MVTCDVCGSEEFEKHAGFMYCNVCQTQSQDYYEQDYDYKDHTLNVIRHRKSKVIKPKKQTFYDDGLWTTWEGFNYILFGMTEEMKNCGVDKAFGMMVFKLWAAYLKECQAAFTSKNQEKIPKLGFNFKQRDARIFYNAEISNPSGERRHKNRSSSSRMCNTSTISSTSKRALALQKRKVIASDYQDHLSVSILTNSNLADDALESLGKSSDLEMTEQSSDGSESLVKCVKHILTKKAYKRYKNSYKSERSTKTAKGKAKKDIHCLGKNKLLSIIHLALLMTGSQIQLSDLLRFIRESHLSYAKVTHFFPNNMKFPKKDVSYIEVISDSLMPTHLRQRKITCELAHLLKVEKIQTPNMDKLIDRYCQDLNLPGQIGDLSKRILGDFVPPIIFPASKMLLPSYEAWAMASIILVMKLVFGINGRTEIFLSRLAREANSNKIGNKFLFVFEDWQKFIECRKTVLTTFHYPTQEQLKGDSFQNSKTFLDVLTKESKDEYRNDRFIPYSNYYMDENLLHGVKEMLSALSKPLDVVFFEFEPSLTPQISHVETVKRTLSKIQNVGEKITYPNTINFPEEILLQNFKNCDVEFAFHPRSCLSLVEKNSRLFDDFGITHEPSSHDLFQNDRNVDLLFDCSSHYWTFKYPDTKSCLLENFREEILMKTPENFQWLITECARMLEMNVRDIYDELLRLEGKLSS